METIVICGAWPYANGSPHIGHIAALLPGDVLAHYYRAKGAKCFTYRAVTAMERRLPFAHSKKTPLLKQSANDITASFAKFFRTLDFHMTDI